MGSSKCHIGQRISYSSSVCTIRYIGSVRGTKGEWLGVEWDNPELGKHAGEHEGQKYFECLNPAPTPASFVRPSRPADTPTSFLSALREKYAPEDALATLQNEKPIHFNGKLAEEVGFEKVMRQQAILNELRIIVLENLCVAGLSDEGFALEPRSEEWEKLVEEIKATCSNVKDLDLSRSLIERWVDVVGICGALPQLRRLVLSANRFRDLELHGIVEESVKEAFANVKELSLDYAFISWDEIIQITHLFPTLQTLSLAHNNISYPLKALDLPHLTTLSLSSNSLPSLTAISPLSALPALTTLSLASCTLTTLPPLPPFPKLHTLDLSSNNVPTLSVLHTLPTSFPHLNSLRVSSNPFFLALSPSSPPISTSISSSTDPTSHANATSIPPSAAKPPSSSSTDLPFILTLSRLPNLKALNYSPITPSERENAELYYLSLIRTQITDAIKAAHTKNVLEENAIAKRVLEEHPLWGYLCEKHEFGEWEAGMRELVREKNEEQRGWEPKWVRREREVRERREREEQEERRRAREVKEGGRGEEGVQEKEDGRETEEYPPNSLGARLVKLTLKIVHLPSSSHSNPNLNTSETTPSTTASATLPSSQNTPTSTASASTSTSPSKTIPKATTQTPSSSHPAASTNSPSPPPALKTITMPLLPKTKSIYTLKSLIGWEINILPSHFRLIWETGELDPVRREIQGIGRPGMGERIWAAEDAESSASESERDEDENEHEGENNGVKMGDKGVEVVANGKGKSGGRRDREGFDPRKWEKREIEIAESTRALGYWIEGREAVIRVEVFR